MVRWRTGTAGFALGVWAALSGGCDQGKTSPPPRPVIEAPDPAPALPELAPGDARWTAHTAQPGRQDVVAVASDGSGGVILLGTSEAPAAHYTSLDPDGTTLTVSRYDGSGQQLWTRSFSPEPHDGGGADVDAPMLAVSAAGDVFVSGRVDGQLRVGDTVITDSAFVAKLAPDGSPRWAHATGPVKALLPEGDGEVIVAHGLVVERQDSRGGSRWKRDVPAVGSATVAALDAEGGLVMAGQKPMSPFESRGFIARLSPDGEVRWERDVGPDVPVFTDVSFRPDGSFVFTGDFTGTLEWGHDSLQASCVQRECSRSVFALVADAYGEPLWGHVMDSGDAGGAEGARLAVDTDGGSAMLWRHGCGSELARLSAGGDVLWQDFYVTTPCFATPLLRDVTFLPGGDVVGAGMFFGTRTFGTRSFAADDTDVFLQRLVP